MPRKYVSTLTLAAVAALGLMTAVGGSANAHDKKHFHSVQKIVQEALMEAKLNLEEVERDLKDFEFDVEEFREDLQELKELEMVELQEDLQELEELEIFDEDFAADLEFQIKKEFISDQEIERIIKQTEKERARAMKKIHKSLAEINEKLEKMQKE